MKLPESLFFLILNDGLHQMNMPVIGLNLLIRPALHSIFDADKAVQHRNIGLIKTGISGQAHQASVKFQICLYAFQLFSLFHFAPAFQRHIVKLA